MEAQRAVSEVEHDLPLRPTTDFEIFDELYPALRRFAAVVADVDIDPDDLVHDALVATLQRHNLVALDQPQAYLKRAVVNLASNKRRRAGRFRALLPKLSNDEVAHDAYPSDLAVLDALNPTDRAVIFMADVDGLAHDVIASELGLSAAAVRKRASRARAQLRELLNAESLGDPNERSHT